LTRPPLVEAEAVHRAAALAALADYCMYIVHLSSAQALEAFLRARSQPWEVYAETCPQYLVLDDSRYALPGFEPAKYVCSPPLRPAAGQPALWAGLADGSLSLVGSDHCPFFFKGQKELGKNNFSLIPNGIPTIEPMFSLLFSRGVVPGKFDVRRFVELSSTNAARLFGLYPRKGEIAVGSDADLVIFDPGKKVTLSHESLHSRVDYTPYEGVEVNGWPSYTISRGEVLYQHGELTLEARAGRGQYLRRRPWTGNPL
jgi:dihydropyrimidinase